MGARHRIGDRLDHIVIHPLLIVKRVDLQPELVPVTDGLLGEGGGAADGRLVLPQQPVASIHERGVEYTQFLRDIRKQFRDGQRRRKAESGAAFAVFHGDDDAGPFVAGPTRRVRLVHPMLFMEGGRRVIRGGHMCGSGGGPGAVSLCLALDGGRRGRSRCRCRLCNRHRCDGRRLNAMLRRHGRHGSVRASTARGCRVG